MNENQPKTTEQMQRDAERRIRDMQQRSNRMVFGNDMPPVPNFVRTTNRQSAACNHQPPPKTSTDPPETQQRHNTKQNSGSFGLLNRFKGIDLLKMFNFQNMRLDSDALVIIALIFLLSTEDTDELLLLALVYIML